MKLSLSAAELLNQLQTVTRVASTRSAVQALSGVMISAQEGSPPELLATDMEIGLRVPLDAEMLSARQRRAARPATARCRPLAAGRSVDLGVARRRAGRRADLGPATFHLRTLRAEDFPTLPAPVAGDADRAPGRGVRADDLPGGALGLARRDPPRPHRHPDVGLRPGAAHGRDRLLPAERQADRARGSVAGQPRGERAGPRPAGAGTDRAAGRARFARRQRRSEPGRLRARRRRALLAPDRRPVPQLSPTAPGVRRSRAAPRRAPRSPEWRGVSACSRRRTRRCGSPSARASSPSPLRPRMSARPARRSRSPSTASPSRSASTPSSCATASRASSPRSCVLKLISPLRPGLIESPDAGDFVYLIMPIRLNV